MKHLITMKANSNLKSLLGILLLLLMQLPANYFAAEKQDEEWDSDFFQFICPGLGIKNTPLQESSAVADIHADDIFRPAAGNVSFEGNVQFRQGFKEISALIGKLNEAKQTFTASGDVRYQDQHIRLTSESIDLDFSNQGGDVQNVKFQLTRGALRGEAEAISLQAEKPLMISDVGFTSCPPGNESWMLESSKVEIDPNSGWGEAEDVVLRVGDIPIFYFPYISFPIDDRRKSGFLYPAIGNSSRNGLELEIPWYWNIAPDKDATFIVNYLSERGLMLGAEYRQLTEHTETKLFAEYLPNDDKGLPGNEDRFFYQLKSLYSLGESWRGDLDLSSVSDDDYFFDFGGDFTSGNRNFLRRHGEIRFNNEHLSFSGLFSEDKLLSTTDEPYSRLPQLSLSFLYPEVVGGLTTNLHMQATAFRHNNAVEAERITLTPELSLPMHWLSGYIEPKMKVIYSHYSQDDPTNNLPGNVTRSVPIFSIDSAIFFERPIEFNKKSFIQTLEPRLFYLYVPKRTQNEIALFDTTDVNYGVDSLFRENRYSGSDRIGDSNQFSLAVTSRFYEPDSGRERLHVTVGRAYYLEDREVNLAIYPDGSPPIDLGVDDRANSALITNIGLELYGNWWLKGELEYDDDINRTEKGVLGLQYRSAGLLLNLRHRLNRYNDVDDIEQAEISFAWPMSDSWSFVGRWQQDIINNRTIDSFAGLEYESCCWAVRLVARRYLNIRLDQQGIPVPGIGKFNSGIYLEFILKGLTNVGKGLDLERDIHGYNDRFRN